MNMTGTIIGILVIAFILLFAIFSTKETIEAKKELREIKKKAEEDAKKAEEQKQALVDHNTKSNEIKEEKIEKQEEINNAKTKEELIAIANGIADNNNDKLRKQGQKGEGDNTSTKTSKTRTSKTNRK